MSVFITLVKRDLKTWLLSSVFYAHCMLFSFFSLAAMFLISNFMDINEADLFHSFFRWHPWIFAITAPVVGIRTWSEESHCGVFEVFSSQPIKTVHLVLAKAVSAFFVVLMSLLLTLPAVITVCWLGEPDIGVIAASYLGSLLCGFAFVCLCQAVSAFMRGSIGAFVCSAALCLILLTAGITKVANIILATFPSLDWVTSLLSGLSVIAKTDSFYQGRIELSALLGFALLIIVSLAICYRALLVGRSAKTSSWFTRKFYVYGVPLPLLISGYFIFSFTLSAIPGFIDVTENQRFQLPSSVSADLHELENAVSVRVFATDAHPKFGYDLMRYKTRIVEMLNLVKTASGDKIIFEVVNPNSDANAARIAAIDEIKTTTFDKGDAFVFGLVIESLDKKRVFHTIDPKRERYFLSDLVQAIVDIGQTNRKKIALITPFDNHRDDPLVFNNWTGFTALLESYQLDIYQSDEDWGEPDLVITFHADSTHALLSEKLKTYNKQGTDVIVFADPLSIMSASFASNDSLALQSSKLPTFVTERGIQLSDGLEVYDFALKTEHATENGTERDPTILTLGGEQFNKTHSITTGFDFVHFAHAGALQINEQLGYTNTVLVKSSTQALLMTTDISLQGASSQVEQAMGNMQALDDGFPMVVLQEPTVLIPASQSPIKVTEKPPGRLMVVSDTDWLFAAIAGPQGDNNVQRQSNANVGLFRNMVDYFTGNSSINELRMRSLAKRPLQKWDDIQQTIAAPYEVKIAEISERKSQQEAKLTRIEQSRRSGSTQVSRSGLIEKQISTIRHNIKLLNAELLSLRSEREAKVKNKLTTIKWLNVLLFPLLVAFFGVVVVRLRAAKVRGKSHV